VNVEAKREQQNTPAPSNSFHAQDPATNQMTDTDLKEEARSWEDYKVEMGLEDEMETENDQSSNAIPLNVFPSKDRVICNWCTVTTAKSRCCLQGCWYISVSIWSWNDNADSEHNNYNQFYT
jgi:hypothetical protein